MTIVTSRTRIAIPRNLVMFIGQIPGVVVLMALYTTKCLEIARRCMALGTLIPFSFVLAAENRKIRLIVLRKICGIPTGVCSVAYTAVGRKIPCLVVRTGGRPEIHFVTSKTIRWRIHKISTDMAFRAVVNLMAFGQREKQVVCPACRPKPIPTSSIMAFNAVGGVTCRLVVGIFCSGIIVEVTINALVSDSVETQRRL